MRVSFETHRCYAMPKGFSMRRDLVRRAKKLAEREK